MIIKSVKLTNFRSHDEYTLKCNKKTSLIVGENGCGKTSILEAIYIAMQGKSFRATDEEIFKRGEDFYRIELNYTNGQKITVTFDKTNKKFLIDDKKTARLPKKYRYPIVLFEPKDLNLVESSPSRRRDYFDRFFAQLDDRYGDFLSKYNKSLKQRNELLKSDSVGAQDVFSWDILLSKYGCELRKSRQKIVTEINEKLTEVYRSIAKNQDKVSLEYLAQDEILEESRYLARLSDDFKKDHLLGYTSFGAHRDNYEFMFNGVVAEGSASRGETRSIILALKFIEAELIFEKIHLKPVVLLDDVFSELDEVRQKSLVNNFKDNQVIITSVEEN